MEIKYKSTLRKPDWLKIRLPQHTNFADVKKIIQNHGLHTICTSGKCPNLGECWDRGTATIMISGDICTRACRFCAVTTGRPKPLDPEEPTRVAESINRLKLKHCVLTSVDRDDLDDKGAQHWHDIITEIKRVNPSTTIEALIPDFDGIESLVNLVTAARPEVISHNMETVRRLTPLVRTRARYDVSLSVLEIIAKSGIVAKSGIMVGLGETEDEVVETMRDIRATGCSVLTIGQYLQPTPANIDVEEYVHPEIFEKWRMNGLKLGFRHVESSPLVRSSYRAEKHIEK